MRYRLEAWLKRTLDLCKKALERSRGPTIRAAEVKIAQWARDPDLGFRFGIGVHAQRNCAR